MSSDYQKADRPAERTDNIGLLVRRLLGDDETPPDLTAAPPLFEAFLEEGDIPTAMDLRRQIAEMVGILNQPFRDFRQRQMTLTHIKEQLWGFLHPFLFDFTSTCGLLAAFVDEVSKPREVKTGTAQVATVRVQIPEGCRPGTSVSIDEERSGVVISLRDEQGFADVMPTELEAYSENGHMPMGMPMGMGGMARMGFASPVRQRRNGPIPG